ncbi:hypothetical protein H0H87_007885 [Tephrocybe sp. NHM501043]|nr:hypothetical protein H0H87_007885 [Tephrocybe sp. NHM501043]
MSKLSGDAVDRSFVVDLFNIHRFVIAGVTVASKFFSNVFYTNSRYAKVGGLPLAELNQLELQFLLLNDFRLIKSSASMQRYTKQLPCLPSPAPSPAPSEMEGETEAETETETETETEANTETDTETTDDESTIRPGRGSVTSASTLDAGSVYSGREAEEEGQARTPAQPWCARTSSSSSGV